jgi:ABC-2 type transport system permease protein
MRIINLALKDLSQILRDKRMLIFLVAMPLGFTIFMGIAFAGAVATPDKRLPLGWYNQDGTGQFAELLREDLESNPDLRLVVIEPDQFEQAQKDVANRAISGVLVIPPGFSDSLLTDQPGQMELIADEYSNLGQSAFQITRAAATRLLGSIEIAHLSAQTLSDAGVEISSSELAETAGQSAVKWKEISQTSASLTVEKATSIAEEKAPLGGNPYNQTSPGIMVQFTIFGLITSSAILVEERKTRTLQRLFTTSMPPAHIILGHLLANFTVAFCQQLILILFGQLFLKVNYLREPLAVLAVMVTLSLWVSSLGLMISVFAKNEQQSLLASLILMFVISALGGAWFPLEGSGSTFATIGHLTPGAWAMDGFQNIIIRGLSFSSVLLPAGVMLGYALLFFAIGSLRFRANINASA